MAISSASLEEPPISYDDGPLGEVWEDCPNCSNESSRRSLVELDRLTYLRIGHSVVGSEGRQLKE